MRLLGKWARMLFGFVAAILVSLAVLGLLLALLWYLGPEADSYIFATLIVSAFAALWAGGVIAAAISPYRKLIYAVVFGFLFGGFSFIYILGIEPLVVMLALFAALPAGLGGWTYSAAFDAGEIEALGAN